MKVINLNKKSISITIFLFLSIFLYSYFNTVYSKNIYFNNNSDSIKNNSIKTSSSVYNKNNRNKPDLIFTRIKNDFTLDHHTNNKLVKYYINKYQKDTYHMKKIFEHAAPYLYYITEEIEKRGLPAELVIIPMIESNYNPLAKSKAGAAGIWQLRDVATKSHGLKKNEYYDGRHDVYKATQIALDNLESLYKRFNNDWYVALAAYNYGEGKISSAIKKNIKNNLPTEYWSLKMPKETRHFVPKLLAIAELINNPKKYNMEIMELKNTPYFHPVEHSNDFNLTIHKIAELAETDLKTIKKLNPGYIKQIVPANNNHIVLLPCSNTQIFNKNLIKFGRSSKNL